MGDQKRRQVVGARVLENETAQAVPERHVELGERLVEQQRARFGQQGAHQRDARPLAAGERRRVALGEALEAGLGERAADPLPARGLVA